jgi:hypothetical protein
MRRYPICLPAAGKTPEKKESPGLPSRCWNPAGIGYPGVSEPGASMEACRARNGCDRAACASWKGGAFRTGIPDFCQDIEYVSIAPFWRRI